MIPSITTPPPTPVSSPGRAATTNFPGGSLPEDSPASGPVKVVCRGDAKWSVVSSEVERLLKEVSVDWFALESCSSATLVKCGQHRSVWRIARDGGKTIFAKVFDDRGPSPFSAWRRWTHHTPAEREWRALLSLQARRVPVIQPLALGVSMRSHRRMVLLTEGVSDAVNLTEAWLACGAAVSRGTERSSADRLILAVARFWANSHDRGFAHPDGHSANVLVQSTHAEYTTCLFADVAGGLRGSQSPRASRPNDIQRAIRSLAQIDQHFQRVATRTQRLRFWRHYWSSRENRLSNADNPVFERRLLARFRDESAVHAADLARQRDRRVQRDGKYFARLTLGDSWRAVVTLQLERRHVFPEPYVPDRTVNEWRELLHPLVKSSARQDQFSLEPTIRCVRFSSNGLADSAYQRLVGSPARRFFIRCHQLRHRDIAASLTLAYLEHATSLGLVDDSMLVLPVAPLGCNSGTKCDGVSVRK